MKKTNKMMLLVWIILLAFSSNLLGVFAMVHNLNMQILLSIISLICVLFIFKDLNIFHKMV